MVKKDEISKYHPTKVTDEFSVPPPKTPTPQKTNKKKTNKQKTKKQFKT